MGRPARRLEAAGWIDPRTLPRGRGGRALCRRCRQEVPRGRRSFCSEACVHEWRVRSDPGYARDAVERRDRGVCAICGLDTRRLELRLRQALAGRSRAPGWLRRAAAEAGVVRWKWELSRAFRLVSTRPLMERFEAMGFSRKAALWEADHALPVVEGGGSCGLENLRTLCRPCHVDETRRLRRRRRGQGVTAQPPDDTRDPVLTARTVSVP